MTMLLLLLALQNIPDPNAPQRGMVQVAARTYSVAVGTPGPVTLNITVTRTAGSGGAVGCSYATVDGSAIAGTDYTAVSGTLSWATGNAAVKTIGIQILNDGVLNGNKTFYFRLTNPTGGVGLGVPPTSPPTNHEGRLLGGPAPLGNDLWNTGPADLFMATQQVLPANNPWNEDVSGLPVLSNSTAMVNSIGSGTALGVNRDMNFVIVPGSQALTTVTLGIYFDESNQGPAGGITYPVPTNAPIENYPADDSRTLADIQQDINPARGGDRHCVVFDPANGWIYEFGNTVRAAGTFNWSATGEASFPLFSNQLRTNTWTSTDAAGLPILPAIPRYDEILRGTIEHALRFTVNTSRHDYVYPATHQAAPVGNTSTSLPRMGERFRLKKNVTSIENKITAMGTHARIFARAMQKYGMIVADNGGNWRISGGSDSRITNLNDLTTLVGSDFEAVQTTGPDAGPRSESKATVTVTDGGAGGGDSTPPVIAIGTPTTSSTHSASSSPLALAGTTSDNIGVTYVSWTNSAGGSGTATLTSGWTASVPLSSGTNILTFTAHDAAGNTSSDGITVTYTAATPGGGGSPGGGGGGGGGGCGLLGLELLLLGIFRRRR